jgi:hypothetical protein
MILLSGAEADEVRADHRGDDAHRADHQRQQHHLIAQRPWKKMLASSIVATMVTA